MSDLSEFLLARFAEDKERAQHADWAMQGEWYAEADDKVDVYVRALSPARVLAECEAKRRIVDAYLDERSRRDVYQRDDAMAVEDEQQRTARRSSAARTRGLEIALEALALPYADHPDYLKEWRP